MWGFTIKIQQGLMDIIKISFRNLQKESDLDGSTLFDYNNTNNENKCRQNQPNKK